MPGIIFCQPSLHPIKYPIPYNDHPVTINIPAAPADNLQVGHWTHITKREYQGNIGFIAEIGEWIKLLIVPCLWSSFILQNLSKECRCSGCTPHPVPMLFDPIQFETSREVKLMKINPHSYQYWWQACPGYTWHAALKTGILVSPAACMLCVCLRTYKLYIHISCFQDLSRYWALPGAMARMSVHTTPQCTTLHPRMPQSMMSPYESCTLSPFCNKLTALCPSSL